MTIEPMKKTARGGGKGKTKSDQKANKSTGIYSSKHIRIQLAKQTKAKENNN